MARKLKKHEDFLENPLNWLDSNSFNRNNKLEENISNSLIYIMDSKDKDTSSHIRRTQEFICNLAMKLACVKKYRDILNLKFVSNLVRSAPFHDIGKIAIPDNILLKPNKLNEDELIVMRTHVEEGLKILNKVKEYLKEDSVFYSITLDIVKYHHEKWDGSGYPYGLKGEEIPISSRLMALVDVYDALTSKRSYKKAFTHEEAVSLILEGKGSHFNPDVVYAFIESSDEFEWVASLYRDS